MALDVSRRSPYEPGIPSAPHTQATCRACGHPRLHLVVDLGMTPLANAFPTATELQAAERFYPLRARVCEKCFLMQLEDYETPETIFSSYPYFSSYSTSWLTHSERYVDLVVERFGLTKSSQVVELASNDGYLLQYLRERDIPVLGVEPAANVAKAAILKGIPTLVDFFSQRLAQELNEHRADLVIANNVLPHVPDLNDFVAGMRELVKPDGVVTAEFPHVMRLLADEQFDTIYHEHFSYFSLGSIRPLLERHGLIVFDVEELPTHGGSLRIYACPDGSRLPTTAVEEILEREQAAGLQTLRPYTEFGPRAVRAKLDILEFLISLKRDGLRIVGYGAPAKGNTLLNYCGIGTEFIDYVVDRNPAKQGRFLPGSHIPIADPELIHRTRPDVVFILPWNLREEITGQLAEIRDWDGRFAVRSPELRLWP